jgi:hypothetical protein
MGPSFEPISRSPRRTVASAPAMAASSASPRNAACSRPSPSMRLPATTAGPPSEPGLSPVSPYIATGGSRG